MQNKKTNTTSGHNKVFPLTPNAFEAIAIKSDTLILDTRSPEVFCKGHVRGSVNICMNQHFTYWIKSLISINKSLLLVCDKGMEKEVVAIVVSIGYKVYGFLKDGMFSWSLFEKAIDIVNTITPEHLADLQDSDFHGQILDVRTESEYNKEHLSGATNTPLSPKIELDCNLPYYIYSTIQNRATIFISFVLRKRHSNLTVIEGGITAIKNNERFLLSGLLH